VENAFEKQDGTSSSIIDFTTEELVRPGLAIRRELAAELEALPQPPPDPNLETFLDLFPATEDLIEQRLRAGEQGQDERAGEIELLLRDLGAEQQGAALAYGMDECAENFGALQ
jgi:hypothetical protein